MEESSNLLMCNSLASAPDATNPSLPITVCKKSTSIIIEYSGFLFRYSGQVQYKVQTPLLASGRQAEGSTVRPEDCTDRHQQCH
jgi:hypothetical protein